jgi:hypothetical protein
MNSSKGDKLLLGLRTRSGEALMAQLNVSSQVRNIEKAQGNQILQDPATENMPKVQRNRQVPYKTVAYVSK